MKAASKKSNITDKEIESKINELYRKNCSGNFKFTSRDQHEFAFRNKTNPPDIGKYNPRLDNVEKKSPTVKIYDEGNGKEIASEYKIKQSSRNDLCPHVVKNICGGSGGLLSNTKKHYNTEKRRSKKMSEEDKLPKKKRNRLEFNEYTVGELPNGS